MPARAMSENLAADVAVLRRFNRFYTRQAGLIEPKHLHTDVSLPEARIIYELAQRERSSPAELIRDLAIDPGQLSRTLQALQRRQLVTRKTSRTDKRQIEIALSAKGRATFAELDKRSQGLSQIRWRSCRRNGAQTVVEAMSRIEQALAADARHPLSSCARTSPETSAGSSRATARSMPRNSAGPSRMRRSRRKSPGSSSQISTRRASAAGSPRPTESASAASCSSTAAKGSENSACSWWSRRARPRRRQGAGERVHPHSARTRLHLHDAVDAEYPACRARHLQKRRLPQGRRKATS